MSYRAALLLALCAGHAGSASAQCVTDHEELDCCSMFVSMPTYDVLNPDSGVAERCLARPEGTVCFGFTDGYSWLLELYGPERAKVDCAEGTVEVLYGGRGINGANREMYLHRLDTDLVKTLRPCDGEGALDARACNVDDVSILELQDGGVVYVPAEPLRFEELPDSSAPDDESAPRDVSFSAPPEDSGCSVSPARRRRPGIDLAVMAALCALAFTRTSRAGRV